MNAAVVIDVGNTRMKWGRCDRHRVVEVAALPPEEPAAWQRQMDCWGSMDGVWAVSGSHPARVAELAAWLHERGRQIVVLDDYRKLGLEVRVDHPDKVGLDRLLNALAVKQRRGGKGPAIIVDAGSAVTVDYLDETGAFRGGAIFPGLRLMAQSLHDYTAKLPIVNVAAARDPPGTNTIAAIEAGVFHAVLGGIYSLIQAYDQASSSTPSIYCSGGDAALLAPRLSRQAILWPEMTLEGIRTQVDDELGLHFDDKP